MITYWTIFVVSVISSGSAYYQGYDYTPPHSYRLETPTTYHSVHHSYQPANHDYGSAYHNFRPAHQNFGSAYHNFGPTHHEYHSPRQPCYYTEWNRKSDSHQWWYDDTPKRWSWDDGGVRPMYPWPSITTENPAPAPNRPDNPWTSALPGDLATCVRSCRITSEYNPVCGTDGITYTNPSRLKCAIDCGANVKLARPYRCDQHLGTTPSPATTVPSPESIRMCMQRCPVTPEYNPVCGTNGLTYTNPGRLECAKTCGVDVRVAYRSRCGIGGATSANPVTNTPQTQPTTSTTQPTTLSSTIPLYPPSSMTPSQITPSSIAPSTDKNTATSPTDNILPSNGSSSPTTPTADNDLGFTIPKEILDSVFTEDPDYSGVIDERHE